MKTKLWFIRIIAVLLATFFGVPCLYFISTDDWFNAIQSIASIFLVVWVWAYFEARYAP